MAEIKVTGGKTYDSSGSYVSYHDFWASVTVNSNSIANNTSNITVSLRLQRTNNNYGAYNLDKYPDVTLKVNGTARTPTKAVIDLRNQVVCTFASWTGDVTHNADGTLNCPIEASFTHYGSDTLKTGSLSGSATLPTIARASEPTVNKTSVKMGESVTITTNRKSTSFTHTLSYSFGGSTGTIATGVGASYAWTVPDLASKISGKTSGSCTITCQTYNGSTLVGSKTVSVTLTIPDKSAPTVSASSVVMKGSVTINTNRKSSNYTHTLTYSFGGETGTIATGVGASYSWSVPDLASKISGKTSDTCTITCQTFNGSTSVGSSTVALTLTVPAKTTPTVSASTVRMGASVTINTSRNSSNFTHTLTYSFGGTTGTIATGVATSYAWTVPDLSSEITGKTSDTCTITCQTYNGSALVGSDTVAFTLNVPDKSTPTLSASTVKMGVSVTITTNRSSSNFTHTLTYSFGGATGTIATGVGASHAWKVPDLASKIAGKTSGTCTITCQTYNGSALVGSTTVTLTLTVPAKSTPTLSVSTAKMGANVTITTNRGSANFTHTLTYSFGGFTGTIATEVGASHTWTVPDLTSKIPGYTSGTCTITCQTYNGAASVGSATVTLTLSVPDKSTPTTSSDTVKMGGSVTITTNRKSSAFTHTLTYSFGGTTGTIATNVGTSYNWTVPDLSAKISGASSGTCTITCQTYNGSALVGSATKTITLTVLDVSTPTVSKATVQMGQSVTIYTNRNSTAYTHKITYTLGSKTETLATAATTSVSWTPPKSLAAYTGNKTSATCTITCQTYNGSALLGSATVTLTLTVPNATVLTLSATSVVMGNAITINTPRETSAYTHDLTYSIAGNTGTIATGVATSYTWTVPLSLASQIPNDTSATITVTCTTKFSGSTAVVGTNTKTFTATVPNNSSTAPGVTMTLSCIHDLPSKFAGIYVEGKSKVQVSYEVGSDYSTIASCKTTVQSVTGTSNPFTSALLSPSGSVAVSGTVTDTRGYSTQKTSYITVVPYSRPRVAACQGENSVVCARCNSDGTLDANGVYLLLKVGRKYSKIESGGTQKNYCKLSYRHKTDAGDESSYSEPITLLEASASTDYVSLIIPNVVPNAAIAYTIQIIVEDDVGEKDTVTVTIPTSFITAHAPEGGHGLTLGGYHDPAKVDVFDCWFDAQFHGDILIGETGMTLREYILSVISEGG